MVSVIIPVYNAEKWLCRSVESVLNQSIKDWELILVDDGSQDKSWEICNKFADSDDRIVALHQENKGVTAARYLGYTCSKGDFLCFLDSDDVLRVPALEVLLKHQKEIDADIVKGSETIVVSKNKYCDLLNKKKGNFSKEEYLQSLLRGEFVATLHASLYKKQLFGKDIFSINRRFKLGEDILMNVMLANKAERFLVSNEILYGYYFNTISALQTQVMSYEYNSELFDLILNTVNLSKSVKAHLKLDKYKYIINYFFIPEIKFSQERYLGLMTFFRRNPKLVEHVFRMVNPNFTKFIFHRHIYMLYSYLYKMYVLYFKQKGIKKKVVY